MNVYPNKTFIAVAGFELDSDGTLRIYSTPFHAQGEYTDGTRALGDWEILYLKRVLGKRITGVEGA